MIRIDDYFIRDGVIDIEATFGSVFHVTGRVIVCDDGEEGSFIAPERGCLLRWERWEQPNVVFDVSDFGEIAKQAKPIERRQPAIGPDTISTPIGTIERYESSYVPIHHLRTTPIHRAKVRELQEKIKGFHVIDSDAETILCAFDSADLDSVLCVLGMGTATKKTTRRRVSENDKRAIARLLKEGVTQQEIAEKLGISQQTVSKHAPKRSKRGGKRTGSGRLKRINTTEKVEL